jgi:hypothetical protein
MSQALSSPSSQEAAELPVSLRALMRQLGQVAHQPGLKQPERFFDALRAICLTVEPALLWPGEHSGVDGFLAVMGSIEDGVVSGRLDEEAGLDALMAALAVHGYLSPAARPVLVDRLSRTLASYRSEFWQEDEHPDAEAGQPQADGGAVVDWNALGARLMRPASDLPGADPADEANGWEAFPVVYPQGPTLH